MSIRTHGKRSEHYRCFMQKLAAAKERAKQRRSPLDAPSGINPRNIVVYCEGVDVRSTAFLATRTWRRLRYEALQMAHGRCECCGASPRTGIRLNVDHIQPRQRRPDLSLDPFNLQVLCDDCNAGKGNWDQTDWR